MFCFVLFLGTDSPRLGAATFVFCCTSQGCVVPTGSCFAVESRSRTIIMTAAHCALKEVDGTLKVVNPPFYLCKSIDKAQGEGRTRFENIQELSLLSWNLKSDIAILQVSIPFNSTIPCIPICPLEELPASQNEDRVKLYKCDVQMFVENPSEMPVLSASATEFDKVVSVSHSHVVFPRSMMSGSSGGPLVDKRGRLVGIHIQYWRARTPLVETVPVDPNPELMALWEAVSTVRPSVTGYSLAVIPQRAIKDLEQRLLNL